MLIDRDIEKELKLLTQSYPVITITGPRQSGKTTLAKKVFPDFSYCNLEHPETREFARSDPKAFFTYYKQPLIIDEIQRVPELLSYIQIIADESAGKGLFILTGSHQFELNKAISQSLAGRTALLYLLPFSLKELAAYKITQDTEDILYTGFMPRIHKDRLEPTKAYRNYFQTYVERDLKNIIQIKNISLFEIFLKLLAGRIGQVLNISSLSNDVGVSVTTLNHWLSILEASFIIYKLHPYYENFGKRLIKSPKIYFTDVGLAVYLLGIENKNQVIRDPLIGNLFENMVVIEALKTRMNQGRDANIYFFRDNNGFEVDMLYKKANDLIPIEIKSAKTYQTDFTKNLKKFLKTIKKAGSGFLIYDGDFTPQHDNIKILNFRDTYSVFS